MFIKIKVAAVVGVRMHQLQRKSFIVPASQIVTQTSQEDVSGEEDDAAAYVDAMERRGGPNVRRNQNLIRPPRPDIVVPEMIPNGLDLPFADLSHLVRFYILKIYNLIPRFGILELDNDDYRVCKRDVLPRLLYLFEIVSISL